MTYEELDNFGNWSHLMRICGMSHNTYANWRRNGYIPYNTQCQIEKHTLGGFIAREEDGKPPFKRKTVSLQSSLTNY